jgi:hypothetical protein
MDREKAAGQFAGGLGRRQARQRRTQRRQSNGGRRTEFTGQW